MVEATTGEAHGSATSMTARAGTKRSMAAAGGWQVPPACLPCCSCARACLRCSCHEQCQWWEVGGGFGACVEGRVKEGNSRAIHPTHMAIPDLRWSHPKVTHSLTHCHHGPRAMSSAPSVVSSTPSALRTPRKRRVEPGSREPWQGRGSRQFGMCPVRARPNAEATTMAEHRWQTLPEIHQEEPGKRALLVVPLVVHDGRFFGGEVALDRVGCTPHGDVQWCGGSGSGGGCVSLVSGGRKRQMARAPARPVFEAPQPRIGLCDNTATAGMATHWLRLPVRPSALQPSTCFGPLAHWGGDPPRMQERRKAPRPHFNPP